MDNSKNERKERGIGESNSEAIEFLEEIKKRYLDYCISMPILNHKGAIRHIRLHFGLDIIIKLLKRGEENEKYKEMYEEFNSYPLVTVKNVKELMNELKQKYFPKGEINE